MARLELASSFSFALPAPNALTNLKAKFKAVFRKKDKKAKEGDTAGGATEATKADTPAAATTAAAAPGGGAPAIEVAKTDEAVQPTTDTAAGAVTEAKPEDKVVETPVAAADATAKAPAAAEIGVATDTKPAGTV
ncbi:hypothetical protein E0Z10_g601 [Xylaria hypoxylon]|uniref:Uncharacterized protein n=1 Tax=Xylaria hypoxylon TaxID=37992 RepID=A0A4Z0ZB48_9PEZI|nr:hypothetical protein E0Z10_g601 [Xylaria hypoxylon]